MNPKKTVIIPYVSAYGYTGMLAEKIAEGIKDSGDVDVRIYDMVEADQAKVLEELGFAFSHKGEDIVDLLPVNSSFEAKMPQSR